jgi:hypothetical protein
MRGQEMGAWSAGNEGNLVTGAPRVQAGQKGIELPRPFAAAELCNFGRCAGGCRTACAPVTLLALATLASLTTPITGRGQGIPSAVVRVRVTDTTRMPLPDVDVAVIKNDTIAIRIGRTNSSGWFTVSFQAEGASYTVAARKLGYVQKARGLAIGSGDTTTVELSLSHLPPSLDTVRVSGEKLSLDKQPYVGADEIARDTRGIFTLNDVLRKLRPDIGYQSYRCPTTPVSTRRVAYARPRVYINGELIPAEWGPGGSIKAEHIAEIRYINCFDQSIPGLPEKPWPSIYVVLKPGYVWEYKRGSHYADSTGTSPHNR